MNKKYKYKILSLLLNSKNMKYDFLFRDVLEAMQADSQMELTSLQVDGGNLSSPIICWIKI